MPGLLRARPSLRETVRPTAPRRRERVCAISNHRDGALAAFLAKPPGWWREQAAGCWYGDELDERRLNPLAAATAYEVFGTATRWQEALLHIEAKLREEVADTA